MKILRVDKFKPKGRSEKEELNSAMPEAKEEYTRIDKEIENQSADGYAEQNASPDSESQTKDESQAKIDAEPEGLSDKPSKAYASRHPGEPSEKSSQNETETNDLTDHNLQTFFESLPHENPEPLSKDMKLHGDLSDREPKAIHALKSKDERQSEEEKTKKSVETEETPGKATASIRTLHHSNLKTVSRSEEEDEERPKRKKKDSGGFGGGSTEHPKFSSRDIFHIVFKRKLEIFLFFIVVLFTVAIGTVRAKPVYEATAQILIKIGRESIFVPASGNMNPVVSYNQEERINSELQILKSRGLAEKVVTALGPNVIYESPKDDKPGILDRLFPGTDVKPSDEEGAALKFESAVAKLQKKLQVKGIKKSNVIQINFTHQNAHMTAKVINTLSDVYLDHHLEIHKTTKSAKFFQDQSQFLKSKLEKSEKELKDLKKQYQITSLDEEQSLLLRQTSDLRTELNRTVSQIVETEKRILQLRKQLVVTPKTIAQGEEIDRNQDLIGILEARLVELEIEESELLAKYTDQSRLVQNVKEEIQIVKSKLKEQEKKSFGRKRSGANPTYKNSANRHSR